MHDKDSIKAGVWTIAANVLTDITVIASYLVLGYVIYGGYLYIFSAGDPGRTAAGRKTLAHAFYVFYIRYANVLQAPVKPFWGNLVGGEDPPQSASPYAFLAGRLRNTFLKAM